MVLTINNNKTISIPNKSGAVFKTNASQTILTLNSNEAMVLTDNREAIITFDRGAEVCTPNGNNANRTTSKAWWPQKQTAEQWSCRKSSNATNSTTHSYAPILTTGCGEAGTTTMDNLLIAVKSRENKDQFRSRS